MLQVFSSRVHRIRRVLLPHYVSFSTSSEGNTSLPTLSEICNEEEVTEKKKKNKAFVKKEDLQLIMLYKVIRDELWIDGKFTVPKQTPWPEWAYGYPLGKVATILRQSKKARVLEKRSLTALERIGFEWKHRQYDPVDIKLAMETYERLYGNVSIPRDFIVPKNDDNWPEETWKMKLGLLGHNIRSRNSHNEIKEDIEEVGFDYEKQKGDFDLIREALKAYKIIFGHLKVPRSYVIPLDDIRYPERMRVKSLGSIVHHIRNHDCFSDHKAELIALGFDYEKQRIKLTFAQLQEALLIYKQLHGHLKIPVKYVIAEDDMQYPEEIRGYGLGQVVWRIRNNKTYREHREDFVAMGLIINEEEEKKTKNLTSASSSNCWNNI